jgi:hypothetical protein
MNSDFITLHTSIFNQLVRRKNIRIERERGGRIIWINVILLCLVTAGRSFFLLFSLVFFYASTYTRSNTLYCARWFGSKGKKRRQNENACQVKNDGESASERMMCRGHSHTRMYYKKTHLLLYSFVFLPFSCLLLFFGTFLPSFSRSLVLLLVVVLIVIRRY